MANPSPKRWTCDEFHRLGDARVFQGLHVILIRGELLEIPAATESHDVALGIIDEVIRRCFPTGFVVRCQMSLVLGKDIDPVPDMAVIRGSHRDFLQKPTRADLVIEVSDSSLDYDTVSKASLYASAGIADYWVVDLVNRRILVLRDPQADAAQPFGSRYATVAAHVPGQTVSPLAAPGSTVAVGDTLP